MALNPAEQAIVNEKRKELARLFATENIFSDAGFSIRMQEMRNLINSGYHPDGTNTISDPDKDHYLMAVSEIEAQLAPIYANAETIYGRMNTTDRDDFVDNTIAENTALNANPASVSFKADSYATYIATRRIETELYEQEKVELKEKRWHFELWPNYYKDYTALRKTADFDEQAYFVEKVAALQTAGWNSLNEGLLKDLFQQTAAVEDKIEQARVNADLSLDDLDYIEEGLEKLNAATKGAKTGVTETQVLYNRLLMRYQALKRDWQMDVGPNFYERAQKLLSEDRYLEYKSFISSLDNLELELAPLISGQTPAANPGGLSTDQKQTLFDLYNAVEADHAKFVRFKKRITPEDEVRVEGLYADLREKAENLLGIQLDEKKSVFTEDVEWWMFAFHGEQWHRTQRLWKQYSAGNTIALVLHDEISVRELIGYFSEEILELDESDVAYNQRFLALDIQLNRLQTIFQAIEAAKAVTPPPPGPPPPPGDMNKSEMEKADLETLSSEELYRYGYTLLKEVNDDMDPFTSTKKGPVNARFTKLIEELETRPDVLGVDGKRWGQYFRDRRVFDATVDWASNSSYAMKHDALRDGDEQNGLKGVRTETWFNEGHVMRLLYGQDLAQSGNVELGLVDRIESDDPFEKERAWIVNKTLEISCELFSEDNNPPNAPFNDPALRGEFHATKQVNDAFKNRFLAKLELELKQELRATGKLAPDGEFSFDQKQDLELGYRMMIFLDLRTYYALPYYLAGWSPQEGIGQVIGNTAKRFENGKGMYIVCGKGKQLVEPALQVSRFSEQVESCCDSLIKVDNLRFTVDIGTPTWSGWWAPTLDSTPNLPEEAKVVFRRKNGEMMVPTLYGAFWLPHKRGEVQANSLVSPSTRDQILAAVGKKDIPGVPGEINLFGMLTGGESAETLMENCEAGFTPSGDMEKDVEDIKDKTSKSIALGISPTKALLTINPRYLANGIYQYTKLALLAFSEKYVNEKDYWRNYFLFLDNLRSTIETAPTASIRIRKELLDDEFCERYGLDPEANIPIYDYVLALLPESLDTLRGLGPKELGVDQSRRYSRVEDDVVDLIAFSVQAHPRRNHNNEELLKEHRKQQGPIHEEIRDMIEGFIRQGSSVGELGVHFVPQGPDGNPPPPGGRPPKKPEVFYQALEIIPLTQKDKQAKEDKPEN